jgi:long-chain acyl-CoA synthetase
MNHALYAGATLILVPHQGTASVQPDHLARVIQQERATMFFGVPTHFQLLLEFSSDTTPLRSLRFSLSAAAPMSRIVAAEWRARFGQPIYEGYGLTESSPFASFNHESCYRIGSIGTPIEGVAMGIVDDHGIPLPSGSRGEIVIKGPNIMLGYWKRPEETQAVLREGWLHTGDVGETDEDGYFYIVDRVKETINVAGQKVFGPEVEAVLSRHPAVAESAVFGRPHRLLGESVGAAVVIRPGSRVTSQELRAHCALELSRNKIPHGIEFVESLPRGPNGKVLKRVLRSQSPQGS